ncbi:uncharacterized protein LOC112194907 isoform X2 [Rosa chinensis]|uniref:uncharacterized protein LOC112194907 isoform X2 n=1 Tax=Rosa chinensis TaxID=74649 RepID=UPI000D08BFD9|nr:uncharacterized protein LOC112194907 isoform X2 [Rosa chinensis]
MSKKAGMEVARSSECFQRQDLAVVPKPDDTKAEEPKARRPSMDPWPYISKLPDGRRIIISRKNPPTEHPCAYTEMPPDDPGPFSQKSKLRVTGPPIPRAAVTGQIPGMLLIFIFSYMELAWAICVMKVHVSFVPWWMNTVQLDARTLIFSQRMQLLAVAVT